MWLAVTLFPGKTLETGLIVEKLEIRGGASKVSKVSMYRGDSTYYPPLSPIGLSACLPVCLNNAALPGQDIHHQSLPSHTSPLTHLSPNTHAHTHGPGTLYSIDCPPPQCNIPLLPRTSIIPPTTDHHHHHRHRHRHLPIVTI